MIIRLPKTIEFKHRNPFIIERTPEIQEDINRVWCDFIHGKEQDGVFNGDVYLVTDHHVDKEKCIIEIGKGKYSEIIYAKATGKITARSLFVASYISTIDGYYGFVYDNGDRLNTIGGMADNDDFENYIFIPEKCLERELLEELGLDVHDKDIIISHRAAYLKTTNADQANLPMYPIGVLYELKTRLTKEKLEEWFLDHKDYAKERDIRLALFCASDYDKMVSYENKVSYILELFNAILSE